ncbi:MAG: hypothetical protein QM750_19995 [Rubrivivax sp.]
MRATDRSQAEPGIPPRPDLPEPLRLTLIGCCGRKLERAAPARELYRSPLFVHARGWAERQDAPWMVLSAQRGLIEPDEVVSPYDMPMHRLTPGDRIVWARQVAHELLALSSAWSAQRLTITLLAGVSCAAWVPLVGPWCTVEQPLRGMPIGRRLQWFSGAAAAVACHLTERRA